MGFKHLFSTLPFVVAASTAFYSPRNSARFNARQPWSGLGESSDVENPAPVTGKAMEEGPSKKKKNYVIVGAGWAGWGAAKALCESGVDADVTILDALPDPTGRLPYLSKTGKPVEPGTRGFWKDYPNINKLCAELGINENDVFTEFTNSSFYSPDGLEATAPVFSSAKFPTFPGQIPFLSTLSDQMIPSLPSPLGQVLATFPLFERIPLEDRASMIGLLVATVDCLGGDEQVQEQYDRMTAHELFIRFRLSKRLVDDFIRPTLLVGLFKPPEELSALVVMELLYYYALAHMDSFDVRWIKKGTVADSLIAPLATSLVDKYGLEVKAGSRVGTIELAPCSSDSRMQQVSSIQYTTKTGQGEFKTGKLTDIDGVILALSSGGMASVVSNSPDLARTPAFAQAASLKAIDVISCRLWLDRTVKTRTPANVFSRFDELRGAGGTFFMLDQLQADNLEELWGGQSPQGSVIACDFYNSGALMSLSEEDLVRILMEELLPAAVPGFSDAKVIDQWVGFFPSTVSWFSPGSFQKRPYLEGVPSIENLCFAGDWVRLGTEREKRSAKGLCQERAYASGLQAGNILLQRTTDVSKPHEVLDVREDEVQFRTAVAVNEQLRRIFPRSFVR